MAEIIDDTQFARQEAVDPAGNVVRSCSPMWEVSTGWQSIKDQAFIQKMFIDRYRLLDDGHNMYTLWINTTRDNKEYEFKLNFGPVEGNVTIKAPKRGENKSDPFEVEEGYAAAVKEVILMQV